MDNAEEYPNELRSYRSIKAYCLGKWKYKLSPAEFMRMGGRRRFESWDWQEELELDCFYDDALMERFKNGE